MTAPIKLQDIINTLSGGGYTGVQADAVLDAPTLESFNLAIGTESVKAHLLRSTEAFYTIRDSSTLLDSFMDNEELWTRFTDKQKVGSVLGINVRAVNQIRSNSAAWDEAIKKYYFYTPLIQTTAVLDSLGTGSVMGTPALWNVAKDEDEGVPLRNWLYNESDPRAKNIFDTQSRWNKTVSNVNTLKAFYNNTNAAVHALDTAPAKLRQGSEIIRSEAIVTNEAFVSELRNHPGKHSAVTWTDKRLRKALYETPTKPTKVGYVTSDAQIIVVDDQMSEVFRVRPSEANYIRGLNSGAGFVLLRTYPAVSDLPERRVLEYHNYTTGPTPVFEMEVSGHNTSCNISLSKNDLYVVLFESSRVTVIDSQTQSVVYTVVLDDLNTNAIRHTEVTNTGEVYIAQDSGYLAKVNNLGTVVQDARVNSVTARVTTVYEEADGNLLVGYYNLGSFYRVNPSTWAVIDTIDLTGTKSFLGRSFYPDPKDGGYYVINNNDLYYLETNNTLTLLHNNVSSGYTEACVTAAGFFYCFYSNTIRVLDRTSSTAYSYSDFWAYDVGSSYEAIILHPTYGVAVASRVGVTPLDSSDEPVVSEWYPIYLHPTSYSYCVFRWFGNELVISSGNYQYIFDGDTGVLTGGYRPPFISKTRHYAVENKGGIYNLSGVAENGDRVYAYTSNAEMHYCDKDGVILWTVNRASSPTPSLGTQRFTISPSGYIYIWDLSGVSVYLRTDGSYVSSVAYSANHSPNLLLSMSGSVFVAPLYSIAGYVREFSLGASSGGYAGGSSTATYPFSSYTRIESTTLTTDHLVVMVRNTRVGQYESRLVFIELNPTTGASVNWFYLPDEWLLSTGMTYPTFSRMVYDPNDDGIFAFYTNEVWKIHNWRGGEETATLTKLPDLNLPLERKAPSLTTNHGEISDGVW